MREALRGRGPEGLEQRSEGFDETWYLKTCVASGQWTRCSFSSPHSATSLSVLRQTPLVSEEELCILDSKSRAEFQAGFQS